MVACRYNGGVVIGADGLVAMGAYIANRASNKLAPLSESIYLLRSGRAADCQAISDVLNYYLEHLKLELGAEPSVRQAARLT